MNMILAGKWVWQIVAPDPPEQSARDRRDLWFRARSMAVFTPTLFVGASLGYLFGIATGHLPLGSNECHVPSPSSVWVRFSLPPPRTDHGHHHDL